MEITKIINILEHFFQNYGYLTIFFGSLIEITPLGWMIPGSTIIAVAGFFSNAGGGLNLADVIIYGSLGAWLTFVFAYFLGRESGLWLVKKLRQEKNMKNAKNLLDSNGGVILTTAMMSNLVRFWVAYIAGYEKYSFLKFAFYSFTAALGWVSVMAFIGYIAGYRRGDIETIASQLGIASWIFLGITGYVIYRNFARQNKKE